VTNLHSDLYSAFGGRSTPRIASFLEWLAAHRGLTPPLHVLDVGCGPGRIFPHFRALGWDVTSMEPDADFHPAATSAALANGYPAPRKSGFLEIDFSNTFNLVTAINDPFAHMLTGDDKTDALRRVHHALKPGGVVFIDVPNFLWILKHYRAPEPMQTSTADGAVTLRREQHIDFHSAVFTTIEHYELVRDGSSERTSKTHAYSMSTLPELTFHLKEAGFVDLETYASWDARDVECIDGSRMMISAART
jgi:SAM-dependent methyltransferase